VIIKAIIIIRKAKAEEEKVKHTHRFKDRISMIQQRETVETNWSRDGLRLKSDSLRKGCRLQDTGTVQGRSESRWRGIAHRRGWREARLARGGIREHHAFLSHEMRGPGLGVVAFRCLGGGKAKAQGRGMG